MSDLPRLRRWCVDRAVAEENFRRGALAQLDAHKAMLAGRCAPCLGRGRLTRKRPFGLVECPACRGTGQTSKTQEPS